MAEDNLTIYQRLQQVFGAGATRRSPIQNYNVDPNNGQVDQILTEDFITSRY